MVKKRIIKISLSILLLLLYTQALSAEDLMESGPDQPAFFEAELKAALSLPSFFWLEDNSWNSVTMFALQGAAWACAEFNITDEIAVQVEAGYNGKGASLDASDGSLKWRFHYLELPVWLKRNYTFSETENFWLGGGGYYSYFLGGSYKFDVPGSEWNGNGNITIGEEEIITEARRHDAGLLFSAGYEAGHLVYEFRFPVSVTSALAFTPEDENTYGGYRKAFNSGILLCIGYKF